jgi:septum formation protein
MNKCDFSNIVLASQSVSKQGLLKQLFPHFEIVIPKIDERSFNYLDANTLVTKLSIIKAKEVGLLVKNKLIIATDTVIVHNDRIIGKPKDDNDAFHILKELSGETHTCRTGMTVIDQPNDKIITRLIITSVTFRNFSDQTIKNYISTNEPFGKAGAYAIQGLGSALISKTDGEYSNIMGFPVFSFVDMLECIGYNII